MGLLKLIWALKRNHYEFERPIVLYKGDKRIEILSGTYLVGNEDIAHEMSTYIVRVYDLVGITVWPIHKIRDVLSFLEKI